MNLKQVEELIQKMKEFEAILDQDRKGCINIADALEPLRDSVFAEYRIQVDEVSEIYTAIQNWLDVSLSCTCDSEDVNTMCDYCFFCSLLEKNAKILGEKLLNK